MDSRCCFLHQSYKKFCSIACFCDRSANILTKASQNYPQSKLSDMKSPESGPKFSANLRSTAFSKSVNLLNVLQKCIICAVFKAKSVNPPTYSFPSKGPKTSSLHLASKMLLGRDVKILLKRYVPSLFLFWENLFSSKENNPRILLSVYFCTYKSNW